MELEIRIFRSMVASGLRTRNPRISSLKVEAPLTKIMLAMSKVENCLSVSCRSRCPAAQASTPLSIASIA
ncbi:hypothetical protein L249_6646 [Ophiocordyceps polyrhachis-furcata BCC 54312]|uniref:Uncharacterized protein n=1 Tax=Ophiocordyceps polyrhachis-furcata BCC 54312 TaxID=1330021 RepID=A0A367LJJ2_9HYPO|nr:hypothetical protein L249_6646 [Ophiocordyceps polyrhachis-furcata BCC 54312]